MAWPDVTTDVQARVLALLRPASGQADPAWLAPSIADALLTCQTDFRAILASRGYAPAQQDTWAAGVGRPHVISTAFFLVCIDSRTDIKDADGQKVEPPAVLDRRQDWLTLAVTDATGAPVPPANLDTAGPVRFGTVDPTGEEFRLVDGTWKKW